MLDKTKRGNDGYYSFELMKYKNRKHEIHEFFLSYNIKYGMQCRLIDEKIGRDKNQDTFLGKDLFYEEKFLNSVIEETEQEIKHC